MLNYILKGTRDATFTLLSDTLPVATAKKKELEKVVTDFDEIWNLAHVVRVTDGKHMRVQCLKIMDAVITITMFITIMDFSA